MATTPAICSRCALGDCTTCRGAVVDATGSTRACCCRHGARRPIARSTDPRTLGGSIIGGAPDEQGGALIDTRNAVLLGEVHVARVDNPSDGRAVLAVLLSGRVNQSPDPASVLFLCGGSQAAVLVAELVGLAARIGPEFEAEFRSELDQQFATEGLWPAVAPAGGGDGS